DTSDHEWIWRQFLVNNNVRDDLGRILDKMIEFGTRKRYQSAKEILQDLTGQSPTTSIQTPATPVIHQHQQPLLFKHHHRLKLLLILRLKVLRVLTILDYSNS
ncbi:MAG: hypothetical protein ACKPGT_14015, partial [Microcystis sp.]